MGYAKMETEGFTKPMVVRRRFKGPDGTEAGGLRWYTPGELVETSGWSKARSLQRAGYLRDPEYGELVEGAGVGVTGRERASSTQAADEAPAPPSPEPEAEAEEEGEAPEPIEIVSLGGGWYNIQRGEKVLNKAPIHGQKAAQEAADAQ